MPIRSNQKMYMAIALAIGWASVYLYFSAVQFDPFRSDVRAYWSYSQELSKFNVFHLPAYSVSIGLLHSVLPSTPPLLLMQLINVGCWVLGTFAVFDIFHQQELSLAWQGAILFALFPLYGTVSVVYPLADTPAAVCLIIGIWAYFRSNQLILILAFSIGLLTHKLICPFIALAVLIALLRKRITLWSIPLILAPLVVYVFLGAQYHHDLLWLFRDSGLSATGYTRVLPLFDAVFGPLFTGKTNDLIQFLIVLPIFGLACVLLLNGSWKIDPILLALIIPIILIGVFFTEAYSQVPLRLGRLLVIPLIFFLAQRKRSPLLENPLFTLGATAILILSQVAFAFYMSEFFFK